MQLTSRFYTALAWATLGTTLLLSLPSAHAVSYNVTDDQRHDHWQSMVLTLGDERHFRAVETHSYADATLSVNATPGVCDLPWLEMRVTLGEIQGESRTVNLVPARLRVDERERVYSVAEFITERADDGFYVHFYLDDIHQLIADMGDGEQIFLGFDQGERDPWYMTFSLEGAGQALTRMQRQCKHAS
ncbi:hypothetical protein LPL18_000800 [Halomonas sp. CUBES01]|uniref:Uncharacterized protein n=1 Tax=Vreelandella gomseomensis TaxID=370766 RepID=A0ABU1GE49_9GAMM|nr:MULTISPECIES: hypothetical protein [Halomonas]MDR5875250.1 hypothetical protein [Halomonas gomseomensis]MEC4765887.1 hypothetical protein [Halomonas sp. CUBES01]